jgi:hypothetical protein
VQIIQRSGGPTLVGAIELVSPGNKDRPEARRAFAAKCAGYLQLGIGLLIVDVVTERQANLHDELIDLLEQDSVYRFPTSAALYCVAYRPRRTAAAEDQIELRRAPLALGSQLPTMPLALRGGPIVQVDLEGTYAKTRQRTLV